MFCENLISKVSIWGIIHFWSVKLWVMHHRFIQGWGTLIPAEFSSNPNQTHLTQLMKVFRMHGGLLLQGFSGLELNSAGEWPSRITFPSPGLILRAFLRGLSGNTTEHQYSLDMQARATPPGGQMFSSKIWIFENIDWNNVNIKYL